MRAQYGANNVRTSYDVRIWKVQVYKRKTATRYGVRWFVAGDSHHDTFTARALADGFRADLLSTARKGTPFDIGSGFPIGMLPAAEAPSWFDHACAFIDSKWTRLAPRSRQSIADGLATVTPALVRTDRGRPSDDTIREVLYGWAFNTTRRKHGELPDNLRDTADWIAKNTLTLDAIDDPPVVRRALEVLATRGDGKQASGNTVARRRAAFSGALNHAVELGHLPVNPLTRIRWKAPKTAEAVDPRSVINHEQAKALLKAVSAQGKTGQRLVGFFACMYYAAMRPAEVIELHKRNLVLPAQGWANFACRTRHQLLGRHGLTETAERPGNSNTERSAISASYRALHSSLPSFSNTSPSTAQHQTADCSEAPAVGQYPTPSTDASGRGPARLVSRPPRPPRPSQSDPTTSATLPSRPG